jgi:hypothetical protein
MEKIINNLGEVFEVDEDYLEEVVAKLKQTDLFRHNADNASMLEKQMIFSVLAGIKKVAEVTSCHWEKTENGRKAVADDSQKVGEFLDSLGLKYRFYNSNENFLTGIIAKDQKYIDEWFNGKITGYEQGVILGYPLTAARAWQEHSDGIDATLSNDFHDELIDKLDVPDGVKGIFGIRFSKENYLKEIDEFKKQAELMVKYGLV